jgi:Ca2+-binding RTX toxin-like protein
MGLRTSTIAAVSVLAIAPGAAVAATIIGRPGNERLKGTRFADTIDGNGGNDRIRGLAGDDTLMGGPGNDRIFANRGQDTIYGGPGNDDLWALARGDVHPGSDGAVDQHGDTLDGGPGDDRFHTRDGEVDRITCGEGSDSALLDTVDVITDATPANPNGSCEQVVRMEPRNGNRNSAGEAARRGQGESNVT